MMTYRVQWLDWNGAGEETENQSQSFNTRHAAEMMKQKKEKEGYLVNLFEEGKD